jgi:uncharacterized protein
MANANLDMLKKVDAAMSQGNPQPMFDMFTDDAVVHIGGRNKLSGDYKGKEEIQKSFGMFMQTLGDNPVLETHAILADDEHAVFLQTAKGTRGGKSMEIPGIGIMHISNGKVTEAWFNDMDPYTSDPWYDEGLK